MTKGYTYNDVLKDQQQQSKTVESEPSSDDINGDSSSIPIQEDEDDKSLLKEIQPDEPEDLFDEMKNPEDNNDDKDNVIKDGEKQNQDETEENEDNKEENDDEKEDEIDDENEDIRDLNNNDLSLLSRKKRDVEDGDGEENDEEDEVLRDLLTIKVFAFSQYFFLINGDK